MMFRRGLLLYDIVLDADVMSQNFHLNHTTNNAIQIVRISYFFHFPLDTGSVSKSSRV
jgi:hypothetical protein